MAGVDTRVAVEEAAGEERRRGGLRIVARVGDQSVGGDALGVGGHHDGVASRHRHVFLRPVFQVVLSGDDVIGRSQFQIAPSHHHDGLIEIVGCLIALRPVGRGEDVDVAIGLNAVDLAPLGRGVTGQARHRRRLGGLGSALFAIPRSQPVSRHCNIAPDRLGVAARDDLLLHLPPFYSVAGGNIDWAAVREIKLLRHGRRRQR